MPTKTINIRESHTELDDLLAIVASGTEVILTDGAKLLARVVPARSDQAQVPALRTPDLFPGAVWTSEDFDEPLSDEFWLGME